MDGLHRWAVDDGRINVAEHDDVKRTSHTVAEIVLHDASDRVRADGEWRTRRRSESNVGDDTGAGVAHDWQRIRNIGEACSREGTQTRLNDDVGRADDVETRTVGSKDTAKRDGLSAEVHDATHLTNPLRRDRRPIGDKERAKNRDAVGTAEWNIRPTRRPIESPVGGVAGGELVGGTDERKAIRGETDIVHQITSVGVKARKIRQGESDGRAPRHGCAGCRKLRTGKARRADTRKPTVRHHKAQVRNRARATPGEQHGLSLEARAIQK